MKTSTLRFLPQNGKFWIQTKHETTFDSHTGCVWEFLRNGTKFVTFNTEEEAVNFIEQLHVATTSA